MTLEAPQHPEAGAKPSWLKVAYNAADTREVIDLMDQFHLNTVCREANCPNLGECYRKRTATFMILGRRCTRRCRFCNVESAAPEPVDSHEPAHIAEAAQRLGLVHVVVTSVTRDDLPDGGASHFAAVIRALRDALPQATVEVLTPDFRGDEDALQVVLNAAPDVFNHNVETIEALYPRVRPGASYSRSLALLHAAKTYALNASNPARRMLVKTGVMLGLGETDEALLALFADVVAAGVDVLTLGQYLQPSPCHLPVERYVTPEMFARYRTQAEAAGVAFVASSPLVRSSYRAEEALRAVRARAVQHAAQE